MLVAQKLLGYCMAHNKLIAQEIVSIMYLRQWDSIAAAIYCNAFGNNDCSKDSFDSVSTKVSLCKRLDSREMELSDLGEITFPTGQALDDEAPTSTIQVFPNFTLEYESVFMRYLTVLLQS